MTNVHFCALPSFFATPTGLLAWPATALLTKAMALPLFVIQCCATATLSLLLLLKSIRPWWRKSGEPDEILFRKRLSYFCGLMRPILKWLLLQHLAENLASLSTLRKKKISSHFEARWWEHHVDVYSSASWVLLWLIPWLFPPLRSGALLFLQFRWSRHVALHPSSMSGQGISKK